MFNHFTLEENLGKFLVIMKNFFARLFAGCLLFNALAPERLFADASDPSLPANDVFVTLSRQGTPTSDLPTSADRVDPADYEKYDALNAAEAISRQTNVQLFSGGSMGSEVTAAIRGTNDIQNLILVDGRPAIGVSLDAPDLSEIPTNNIDHIEILRGGASGIYGPNAMGGVINIITRQAPAGPHPEFDASTEMRSFGGQEFRLSGGARTGPVDYYVYGDKQLASGFRDNSDAQQFNVGGNFGYNTEHFGKLLFDVSTFHRETGEPGTDPLLLPPVAFNNTDEKAASAPTARQSTDTNTYRATYLLPLPGESLLTLRYFDSERHVDLDDATDPLEPTSNDRHELSRGGEGVLNLPYGFTVGGNFIHDRDANNDRVDPTMSFRESIESWGFFAENNFHWKQFTLIPSGRFDHHSRAGDTTNPRVQGIVDATSWLRFSASTARAVRAPVIDELFAHDVGAIGNPDLKPEKAWTYDAGFELHEDSESLRVTYFRANVSNLITASPSTENTFVNVGKARRQGAEIEIADTRCTLFHQSLNYTYLEDVGIPDGFDHYVTLPYTPRNTINYIGTLLPMAGWELDSLLRFEDTRYSDNDQSGEKFGSQLIWDLRTSYAWRWIKAYIGVNDVANKRYEEIQGFPLPGRTYYGGLSYKFQN